MGNRQLDWTAPDDIAGFLGPDISWISPQGTAAGHAELLVSTSAGAFCETVAVKVIQDAMLSQLGYVSGRFSVTSIR